MAKPIYEDQVVAEIHAIRKSLVDQCGGDINEYRKCVRSRQESSGRRIITEPFRVRTGKSDTRRVADSASPDAESSAAAR